MHIYPSDLVDSDLMFCFCSRCWLVATLEWVMLAHQTERTWWDRLTLVKETRPSYGAPSLDSRGRLAACCDNAPLTGLWPMMKDNLLPLKNSLLIIAHSRGESALQRIKPRSVVCRCAHDSNRFGSADALTRASSLSAISGNELSLAITENEPTREAF